MQMTKRDKERISRYRKAYPSDTRSPEMILQEMNEVKSAKKKADKWIERNIIQR
jgi:hypothetical protein